MPDSFDSIQENYIAEVRALKPILFDWWMKLTGIETMNEPPASVFDENWPFKISGHPRLIEIFRRYYMKTEDLNDQALQDAKTRSENRARPSDWMEEEAPPVLDRVDPIDLLVWDIQEIAPDIYKLAAGIVYVPIGLNQYDERV